MPNGNEGGIEFLAAVIAAFGTRRYTPATGLQSPCATNGPTTE